MRANTVDVTDGTVEHRGNPREGIEMAVLGTELGAEPAAEPAAEPDVEPAVEPPRRTFERYETEDGEVFFVEEGTEESVWDLPEDGEETP